MLDRDVQNHLGRRLRALYGALPGDERASPERKPGGVANGPDQRKPADRRPDPTASSRER